MPPPLNNNNWTFRQSGSDILKKKILSYVEERLTSIRTALKLLKSFLMVLCQMRDNGYRIFVDIKAGGKSSSFIGQFVHPVEVKELG